MINLKKTFKRKETMKHATVLSRALKLKLGFCDTYFILMGFYPDDRFILTLSSMAKDKLIDDDQLCQLVELYKSAKL